jgi:hypothetical protein
MMTKSAGILRRSSDSQSIPAAGRDSDIVNPGARAVGRAGALVVWPLVGVALLAFEIYVLVSWVIGPNFTPTDPGPDPLPQAIRVAGLVAQTVAMILGSIFVYRVVRGSGSGGRTWDTVALLGLSWCLMWFWDPMMNFASTQILYNSHLVNFGSWTLGSTPGWISPNGNLLPEPLLIVIPGYPLFCLGSVLLTERMLRPFQRRFGKGWTLGIGFLALALADTVIEIALVRTGLYVFPGGIRQITLFAGEKEQFPLTEALFCGLAWSASLALLLWRDAQGSSFVERGVDRLSVGPRGRSIARLLAVFGWSHLMVFALWVVPNQWLALHSDSYPAGYPSYLINHMCVYGIHRDECPGPNVRSPDSN